MAAWDDLKNVLKGLVDEQPGALTGYPDPSGDEGRRPPFAITLAPWAVSFAADLDEQFGDDVNLTVGALAYPPSRTRAQRRRLDEELTAELLDPGQAVVELDGPASVRSGYTLAHGLLVRNLSSAELHILTNGQITAVVVDPNTRHVVGGFAGAQRLPLVTFHIGVGQIRRIPLLIGTASFVPELGYAVPAGRWGVRATITLGPDRDAARWLTPVLLPLTVTA